MSSRVITLLEYDPYGDSYFIFLEFGGLILDLLQLS